MRATLPTTLDAIVRALDGGVAIRGPFEPAREVRGVSTDSRAVAEGDLFVALAGKTTTGSRFLADAFARGAAAALVARAEAAPSTEGGGEAGGAAARGPLGPVLAVPDPLAALGRLAAEHRRGLAATVVGITGSVGKTTTRELLRQALAGAGVGEVVAAERSFNNAVGVPLTLLRAREDTRHLLVEIGTSAPGEIRSLARLARPDVGLVTRVAPAHLEGLGDLDGVAREKGALIEALPPRTGIAVLNADDPRVRGMAGRGGATAVLYGRAEDALIRGEPWIEGERTRLWVRVRGGPPFEVRLPFASRHHAMNALAALACAHALGVRAEDAARALESASLPARRLERREVGGVTLIDDAYNASPASVEAALEALALEPGRRIAVLGSMLELGAASEALHREVGERAALLGLDLLVGVGPLAAPACEAARARGLAVEAVADAAAAVEALAALVRPGDRVLVKASRGARLEEVVEGLAKRLE